jgi:3',5'-cyclic AMP phosphodiesterase CpdA
MHSLEDGVTQPDGTTLRIAHVSDIHVGAHDELTLDGLAQDLHDAQVAATIVTGDLTMRARTHEFVRAKQVIDTFPEPTMIVIGNHDVPLTNPMHRMASPYGKYRAEVTENLDPVLDLGMVRIQGLGSMPRWRWKSGRISDRQSQDIRDTFADCPPGAVRVVAMHHPPSSEDLESLAGGAGFEQALVDSEVDIVLAGHTHVPAVQVLRVGSGTRTRSIIEVVAGTATSHRTRGVVRSWSLLEITSQTLTVTEHHASEPGWRADPPQVFPLPEASHRGARGATGATGSTG